MVTNFCSAVESRRSRKMSTKCECRKIILTDIQELAIKMKIFRDRQQLRSLSLKDLSVPLETSVGCNSKERKIILGGMPEM